MTDTNEIEAAFDGAIDQVQRAATSGMTTLSGGSALQQLGQLEFRLREERAKALERGAVSRDWVQKTIRWTVEWTPETDITLIAALGRIARLAPPDLS
ncbi:MAG TPA: hypothetical protein VNO75_11330 [Gemmatimonadaceae bacterium]|nr:hypothetical protein [Gemmatimonadaceae bacterium]